LLNVAASIFGVHFGPIQERSWLHPAALSYSDERGIWCFRFVRGRRIPV